MLIQENWCVDIAVQLEGEFHLCIFRLSGYCYMYYNKFSEVSTTNSSLNHYTSTTESFYFRHIAICKTLKLNRDSLLKSTILAIESASVSCPIPSGSLVPICLYYPFVWSTDFQTAKRLSISHCLNGNPRYFLKHCEQNLPHLNFCFADGANRFDGLP